MFIIIHLFAGAVGGYGIARYFKDCRLMLFCMAGSVVPDLIDKPLGYILLPQVLDSGRTFFHTFLIVAIVAASSLMLWNRNRFAPALASFAAGILLHQVLDAMWQEPVTWFYPLLGPFQPYHYINYFQSFFWLEIETASEWICLGALLMLLLLVFNRELSGLIPVSFQVLDKSCQACVIILSVLGIYSLVCAISGSASIATPYADRYGNLIIAAVTFTGIVALLTARSRYGEEPELHQT